LEAIIHYDIIFLYEIYFPFTKFIFYHLLFHILQCFSKELISIENTIGSFTIKLNRYSSNSNKYSCDISLTGHKFTNDPVELLLFNLSNDLISRVDLSIFSFTKNRKIKLDLGITTFNKSDCMSVHYLKLVKSKN